MTKKSATVAVKVATVAEKVDCELMNILLRPVESAKNIKKLPMKSFVLHDESWNTRGFRMLVSGGDLTEFRKNPVLLLNHNDWSMPIGRWENIRVDGTKILADPVFDDNDPVARQVADKVERNFIRAASIGAWVPNPEDSLESYDQVTGKRQVTIKKWMAREASIVTIPANHNALAFYDRTTGDLVENEEVMKLFDLSTTTPLPHADMKQLAVILKLADTATEAEVTAAVQAVLGDNDRLRSENVALSSRIDEFNQAAKDAKTAQAVALVDAAIAAGQIDAKARENFLKLFDSDFDAAKATLEAIPVRKSVTAMIEAQTQTANAELADLAGRDWDDLDKSGKLTLLKSKYPDVYAEKFELRFGKKTAKS